MEEIIIHVAGVRLKMYDCGNVVWGDIPCQLWRELMPSSTVKASCRPTWALCKDDIYRDEDELDVFLSRLSNELGRRVMRLDDPSVLGERGYRLQQKGIDFSGYKEIYIMYYK